LLRGEVDRVNILPEMILVNITFKVSLENPRVMENSLQKNPSINIDWGWINEKHICPYCNNE